MIYAIGDMERATTGSKTIVLPALNAETQPSFIQKKYSSSVATTKDGIAVISVIKNTINRSGHLFRIKAAVDPKIIPAIIAKTAARRPNFADIGKLSPMIAGILTGSMVVESIFNIGGLGSKFVSAITNRDYTLIMATTIFLAVIMVIANLITDIIYKVIDPRIKLD